MVGSRMAKIGVVSNEQFESELVQLNRPAPKPVIPNSQIFINKGRKNGDVNVPESIQKLIGEESALYGRSKALELASDLGISNSSVSAYANGSTSTASYNKPSDKLTQYLTSRKNRATKKSLRVLHSALDSITPEKLAGIKGRDLAGIAKDMSSIVKNMEPSNMKDGSIVRPQFVVFAPTFNKEESYETIIVNDNF